MVQSAELRLREIEDAQCTANYALGLMEGIAEILQRLAAMDNRLGEINNRLTRVNAMSFNHRIIGRNSRTQPICQPQQKNVPGHGFDPSAYWGCASQLYLDIASYSSRDINELIIFYNDDFGIVEDDDEAARHTKFIYIYVMLLILCRVLSACSLPETYLECNVDVEQGTRDKGPDLDAAMQDLPFSVVPLPPPPTPTTAKSLLIQRPLYKPKPKPRPTPGTGTAPPPRKRHVRQPGSSNAECTSVLRRVTTSRSTPPSPPFSLTPRAHVGGPALAPAIPFSSFFPPLFPLPSSSPPPSSSSSPLSPSSCLLGFVRVPHRVPALVVIHRVGVSPQWSSSASQAWGPARARGWVGLKGAEERCWGDGNGRVCIRIRVEALGSLALGNAIVEDFSHPLPFPPSLRLRLRLRLTSPFTHTVLSLSINIHGMRNLPPTPAQPYPAPPTPPAPLPSAQPSTHPRRAQASLIAAAAARPSRYRRRCRSRAPPAAHARPVKRINASSGARHEGCWWVGVRLTTAGERDEDVPGGPQCKRDKGVRWLVCVCVCGDGPDAKGSGAGGLEGGVAGRDTKTRLGC
ncbi:hypothetical protein D9615_008441 [Tricholomella constricta]|uniref:Uncharacterized protein n=1 Tax=Tricholomella constricta TaxID=117010 RepID=A0A8H5M026_9AGAR|nr:hypothetical protein D9615_008441 [Tricholomella constricta]